MIRFFSSLLATEFIPNALTPVSSLRLGPGKLLYIAAVFLCIGLTPRHVLGQSNDWTMDYVDSSSKAAQKTFGCGFLDINKDDRADLLLTPMGAPIQLLVQDSLGGFSNTERSLGSRQFNAFGCSMGDLNGDHATDIYINNFGGHDELVSVLDSVQLQLPSGVLEGLPTQSSAFVDIDNDGDLDIHVLTKGSIDFFFRNSGSGIFESMQIQGLTDFVNDSHHASWADFDMDGDPDVFISTNNAEQESRLLENTGGLVFRPFPLSASHGLTGVAIGSNVIDFDNDGDFDLFVSRSLNQKNLLLLNDGKGGMHEASAGDLSSDEDSSMGSCWADWDNDGDLDVFVANSDGEQNALYRQIAGGTMERQSVGQMDRFKTASRACAWRDIDNDGDLDLLVTQAFGDDDRNVIFKNPLNPSQGTSNWIEFNLVEEGSNSSALGATIRVYAGDSRQNVYRSGQSGAYSADISPVHVGLGSFSRADSVVVEWPSGTNQTLYSLPANKRYEINEQATPVLRGARTSSGKRRSSPVNIESPIDLETQSWGDTNLAGTLYIPEGSGPFPTVIFAHGSERGTRKNNFMISWAKWSNENGLAALIWDKRGVADSEGDYFEAPDIDLAAQDVIAWLEVLKRVDRVDAQKIGIIGFSQGGWVGPLAAFKRPDLAFVVSVSGPGVSPLEQNIFEKSLRYETRELTTQQKQQAGAAVEHVLSYLVTGEGKDLAAESWNVVKDEDWFTSRYTGIPFMLRNAAFLEHPRGAAYVAHSLYEPVPTLKKLEVPMLAIFGEKDRLVPVDESVKQMLEAFDSNPRGMFEYRIFMNANHAIFVEGTAPEKGHNSNEYQLAEGYLEYLFGWIKRTLKG